MHPLFFFFHLDKLQVQTLKAWCWKINSIVLMVQVDVMTLLEDETWGFLGVWGRASGRMVPCYSKFWNSWLNVFHVIQLYNFNFMKSLYKWLQVMAVCHPQLKTPITWKQMSKEILLASHIKHRDRLHRLMRHIKHHSCSTIHIHQILVDLKLSTYN